MTTAASAAERQMGWRVMITALTLVLLAFGVQAETPPAGRTAAGFPIATRADPDFRHRWCRFQEGLRRIEDSFRLETVGALLPEPETNLPAIFRPGRRFLTDRALVLQPSGRTLPAGSAISYNGTAIGNVSNGFLIDIYAPDARLSGLVAITGPWRADSPAERKVKDDWKKEVFGRTPYWPKMREFPELHTVTHMCDLWLP